MKRSLAKKISVLLTFALVCVTLTGCLATQAKSPTASGTYTIHRIELTPNVTERLNIVGFENQQGRPFEFSFAETTFVTVSYIFFADPNGDRTFRAHYTSGPTTYRQNGDKIVVDVDFDFIGATDIRIYEGWIILNYTIENQLVYTARYRKTA